MSEPKQKYQIEVDEDQLALLSKASELLGRISLLQLDAVVDAAAEMGAMDPTIEVHQLKKLLAAISPFINRSDTHRVTPKGEIALDLWRVFRYHLAWERHHQRVRAGITEILPLGVDFDPPSLRQGSQTPLCTVTKLADLTLPIEESHADR